VINLIDPPMDVTARGRLSREPVEAVIVRVFAARHPREAASAAPFLREMASGGRQRRMPRPLARRTALSERMLRRIARASRMSHLKST